MRPLQDRNFLENEIYAVTHGNRTLAYAPLTRFFSVHEWTVSKSEIPADWKEAASNPENVPEFVSEKGFADERKKLKVRMNVTSACNLNCSYCSVSAQAGKGKHMDEELALRAVSQMVEFAKETGMGEIELAFSGGEPTLQSGLIEKIVAHADERVGAEGIQLVTKLLTNGVLSRSVAERMVPLFNGIQVSWDGFLENHPRYGTKNAQISKTVWENIRRFSEAGSTVNVAMVASEENAGIIGTVVDEIYETFRIEHLFIALKDRLWKASSGENFNYEALREEYVRTWKKYRRLWIDVPLTGTDIHSISQYPCGVSAPNFSIAPNGTVSSCTVSFNDSDDFARSYDFGAVTQTGLKLNESRIVEFQKIDVASLPECSDCFAKWHCRGWCAYANRKESMRISAPERCEFIRKVVADKILFLAGIE